MEISTYFKRRRAGILLHPISLPGPREHGDFGADAFRFIEFLAAAGQTVWQVLPLGPTHEDGSPYQCLSAHAGNPRFISIQKVIEAGWLTEADAAFDFPEESERYSEDGLLARAYRTFCEHADNGSRADYEAFLSSEREWLEDYALYIALRRQFDHIDWPRWPAPLRDREEEALSQARRRHHAVIELVRFKQFLFYRQWSEIKAFANRCGVLLFGDMPIFVAHDSVDVWANQAIFNLDEQGQPAVVAGVPPDYFSSTGQRWGNPHYRWDVMERDGYSWWIKRIESQLKVFDLIRIDHFRGFESFWEIPADHPDAKGGRWVEGPGSRLFDVLRERFGSLPFVAEDLGYITPPVHALRDQYGMPGMGILQFAFDGSVDNPYLPHNHRQNMVMYTGTHDNDVTLGWYQGLPVEERDYMLEYLGYPQEPMPWPLIRRAMESVANMAMVPMQDVLGLDSAHRMNTPGTGAGNWTWRFSWEQVSGDLAARLKRLTNIYGR